MSGSLLGPDAENQPAPDLTPRATAWTRALAAWGIPQPLLDAAPADPWVHPVDRFAARAERAVANPSGMSYQRAMEAMSAPGTVLDVGVGAGAASLPLGSVATSITGVDTSQDMLDAFAANCAGQGVRCEVVRGNWPSIASQIRAHDLVLAYHVVYNAPAIGSFLLALTNRATRRVVIELTPGHPLSWLSPLWQTFHGIPRPVKPTYHDLVEVLRELGVADLNVDTWQEEQTDETAGPDDQRIAEVTQRLCLSPDRRGDVAAALQDLDATGHRELVTISWRGVAKPKAA